MSVRRPACLLVALAALVSTSCFPVELAAGRDGSIAVPRPEGVVIYDPAAQAARLVPPVAAGQADAFAVPTPDGRWLVRVTRPYDGTQDPGSEGTLWITHLEDGTSRKLATFENGTFLQVAPRDGRISWSFVSDEQHDGVAENMPELHVMEIQKGTSARVAVNVSVTHRWMPDGANIVYLRTEGKDTDGRVGSLIVQDVTQGTTRRIARVSGAEWFDLSPNGTEVILSAQGMAALEGRRRSRGDQKALYIVSLADGSFRRLEFNAEHARYSPDGDSLAIIKDKALWILGRDGELPQSPVFRGITNEVDNGTKVHLSWSGNHVLVLAPRPRFGVVGLSPELVLVHAATGEARNVQAEIDRAARTESPL